MTLYDLARTILLVNQRPISKVRLARVIYFVHKELIRHQLMSADDILYVRSPLGPIPSGYLTLARDSARIIAQQNVSSNLSYASEEYTIDHDESDEATLEQYRDVLRVIEKSLKSLNHISTPDLVTLSHREPSWASRSNGEIYRIAPADLKITLPSAAPMIPLAFSSNLLPLHLRIRFIKKNKDSSLQANLLRGMIEDIVRESTDLEHPDAAEPPSATKPTTAKSPKSSRGTEDV